MRTQLGKVLSIVTVSVCLCGIHATANAQTDPTADVSETTAEAPLNQDTSPPPSVARSDGQMRLVSAQQHERAENVVRPNRQLLASGFFMLTVSYVPTALVHFANEDHTTDNLYIPVAGPWLEFAREPTSSDNRALLILSGVFQDLGAFFFLMGLLVPDDTATDRHVMNQRFSASPMAGRDTYGVSARGRF